MRQKDFYKKNSNPTIEDSLYLAGAAAAALLLILSAASLAVPEFQLSRYFYPCFFHLTTGYYCPGCGGTRAAEALFHGHLVRAVCCHPFVPYTAVMYLCFMASQTIERISRHRIRIGMRFHSWQLWTAAALVIGNFIIKNLLHCFCGFIL